MRSHTTRSGRTRRTFAVIVGLVALASVACGGDDDDDASSTASTDAAAVATDAPAATEAPAATDASDTTDAPAGDADTATTAAGDEAPATMPAVEDHPHGGILRYAAVAEPTTLDPHRGTSGGDHVSLYPIFDRLLNSDPKTLQPQPFLAKSWEFTDPQTLAMTLQEGVTFHDGTPFNAEAVVYNVERAKNLEDSSIKPDLSSVESVEATGEYEVTMHLNQPDSSLLGVFADRAGMMVSPTAAEADPDFGHHPIGTGPHTFVEWKPGDTWTYERNEDYWQEGLPYLDGLAISLQADGNTRINGLRSGQFDFVEIAADRIAELEAVDDLVVSSDPTLYQSMVWWNMGRGPLADVRVRRAINMAIDRQSMWEATAQGTGEVAWLPVPSQHWAYAPDLVPSFEYDPEAAKALLVEAGYGDGFTLAMTTGAGPDAVRIAEIMQAQLAEIGITVNVTPEQTVDSVQSYFTDQRMDAYNSAMTSRPDPSITFQTMFSADSFFNTSGTTPEGFEDLLRAAKAAQTLDERKAAFHDLEEAAVENAMWIPLMYPTANTAYTDDFAGFVPSLIGKPDFLTMYQQSCPRRPMLSAEDNELLTRTGRGTPMGELFRRFWMPVLLARELPDHDGPPVRVRVLGEDLVAFRDSAGRVGLVDARCSHRGADLWFGRNEECGLRCVYHGWKFDADGRCVDIPTMAHDEGLRARVGLTAYPTREAGELIWAYLGPAERQPPLPELEFCTFPSTHRFVTKKLQECNWAQACEGALDTAHFSFLHTPLAIPEIPPARRIHPLADATRWMKRDAAPVFHVLEHDAGLLLAASRRADDDQLYWRVTQYLLPNHSMAPGSAPGDLHFGQTWVPIDDHSCWVYVYSWHPDRPLTDREDRFIPGVPSVHADVDEHWVPRRNRANDYLIDREAQRTRTFTGIEGLSEQDAAIQDSQGLIADRTREHLGPTDLGVIRFRRSVLGAARALAAGCEPPAATAPAAYRVRGGAMVTPSSATVEAALRARFGTVTGAVSST